MAGNVEVSDLHELASSVAGVRLIPSTDHFKVIHFKLSFPSSPSHPRLSHAMRINSGPVDAKPYQWPHDGEFNRTNTALVIIDMQRDCASPLADIMYNSC